jgi:hypothetical protein
MTITKLEYIIKFIEDYQLCPNKYYFDILMRELKKLGVSMTTVNEFCEATFGYKCKWYSKEYIQELKRTIRNRKIDSILN